MSRILMCLWLLAEATAAPAPTPTQVPQGKHVLVNGYFAPGEWSDAAELALDADHKLRAKQDGEYLYLAVEFPRQKHSGLELFLSSSGETAAYHVSSALARRTLGPEGWSAHDWRADRWAANVIGTISDGGKMRVLEPDGFEVQLNKSLLKGSELLVRIELKRPAVIFPLDSQSNAPQGWIRLAR